MSRLYFLAAALAAVVFLAGAAAPAAEGDLAAQLRPERNLLLAGSDVTLGVDLSLQAGPAPAGGQPVSLALSVVIDRSGSMQAAGKMDMVHRAGTRLVDKLGSGDQLGLVTYDSVVETIRPLAPLGEPAGIQALIRQLSPRANTNLGGGLERGIGQFGELAAAAGQVRRLFLLTDGLANEGVTDQATLCDWARKAFNGGDLRVTTVGLGQNYNEHLLRAIAAGGGGEFYYIEREDQLPAFFQAELEEGRQVVVRGLATTIRTEAGAQCREMIGFEFTNEDEQARQVRIGDLFAEEKRALLLRFSLAPPAELTGGTWRAATVTLDWQDPAGQARQLALPLEFTITRSETEVAESVNPDVRARVVETENYQALDQAMNAYQRGDQEEALRLIDEAQGKIRDGSVAPDDRGLMQQSGELAQARREIEQGHDARSTGLYNTANSFIGSRGGNARFRGGFNQVSRAGGSPATQSAVSTTSRWLARHQEADGSWAAGEGGDPVAATALSLLAFLGEGYTDQHGRYQDQVGQGLAWLIGRQQANGLVGEAEEAPAGEEPPPARERFRVLGRHALAAVALAEASGMTNRDETRAAAQKAMDYIVAQRPFTGLAGELGAGEALSAEEVLGFAWLAMAAKSAQIGGLDLPDEFFPEMTAFLESRRAGPEAGQPADRYAFSGGEPRPQDTVVALLCGMYAGRPVTELAAGFDWCLAAAGGGGPADNVTTGGINWDYLIPANLVAFNIGGERWERWNGELRQLLLTHQVRGGEDDGSWEPDGAAWGAAARVYTTALGAMTLEVYYRYLPVYQ